MVTAATSLNVLIDELLKNGRPDRYTADTGRTEDGKLRIAFLEEIAVEIEPLIVEKDAVRALARTLVVQREVRATRSANKFLRDFAETGQLPMLWTEDGAWPLSVVTYTTTSPIKKLEERVALRAVTVDDARLFANEERRVAAKDFAARNQTCVGAEKAANGAIEAGVLLIWDWFQVAFHPSE